MSYMRIFILRSWPQKSSLSQLQQKTPGEEALSLKCLRLIAEVITTSVGGQIWAQNSKGCLSSLELRSFQAARCSKITDLIGLYTPKGSWWGNKGRKTIRDILNSTHELLDDDYSETALAARHLESLGNLNGVTFIAEIGMGKGPNGLEKIKSMLF